MVDDVLAGGDDAVFIRGLEFEANHGYTAPERRQTRRFRVDIELTTPLSAAAQSDSIRDTIDYRSVCETAVRVGTESTFKLIEALAGHIAEEIRALYPHSALKIVVQKLAPPCRGAPVSSGVRLNYPPKVPR